MFVAALSPGVSETDKAKTESLRAERDGKIEEKSAKQAAKQFIELTSRPLRDLDFRKW